MFDSSRPPCELLADQFAQFVNVELRRVDDVVGQRADGPEFCRSAWMLLARNGRVPSGCGRRVSLNRRTSVRVVGLQKYERGWDLCASVCETWTGNRCKASPSRMSTTMAANRCSRFAEQLRELRDELDGQIIYRVIAEVFEAFRTVPLPEPLRPVMITSSERWSSGFAGVFVLAADVSATTDSTRSKLPSLRRMRTETQSSIRVPIHHVVAPSISIIASSSVIGLRRS